MEEREKKAGGKYLRTRFFSAWLNSEKQALCWTLNLRLFPENVSSFPSDRAVSWGSKDGRKCCWRNPKPSLSTLKPPQREGGIPAFIYLISSQHTLGEELVPILRASRMNLFTFWRWKAAKCCDISQEGWCKKQSLYEEQGGNTYMET